MPNSETDRSKTELPERRSAIVSTVYAVFGLIFFFGVGLAGGAVYRLMGNDAAGTQLSDGSQPPPHPASQVAAAQPPNAQSSAAKAPASASPSDQSASALPPSTASPPMQTAAATPAPLTPALPSDDGPAFTAPNLADINPTAPPSVPPPPEPAIAATVVPASPDSPPATADSAKPARPSPSHTVAAVPPKKPPQVAAKPAAKSSVVAKTVTREAPAQAVALHAPPTGPGNSSAPYRVQFGAFANEENARRVQWAVEATGLKVEVTQAPGASGHALYYLRSPVYDDYAAALSAAQTVQSRVQRFVNAIPIEYAIQGDHAAAEQQAQAR